MKANLTDSEKRKRNRLGSERYRRAHGIMPSHPAQRPWIAFGISRSFVPVKEGGLIVKHKLSLASRTMVGYTLNPREYGHPAAAGSNRLPGKCHKTKANHLV
jgi:hypothetical protein